MTIDPRIALRSLEMTPLVIPFTTRFRHASAERGETSSVVVTATTVEGLVGTGEGCPRPYVTAETVESAQAFFAAHRESLRHVASLDSLRTWIGAHTTAIDLNPAAWCAVEMALLDVLGRTAGVPLEPLVGLMPLDGVFQYTAVLGDMGPEAFGQMAARYHAMGFRDFKVKLSGDRARDRAKLAALAALDDPVRVRVDANNLWQEIADAAAFLRGLEPPLFAVEEPLAPAGRVDDLARLAGLLATPIVVDESVTTVTAVAALPMPAARWIVNLRVSKMGGVWRSLAVLEAARAAGLGVIVGAQVGETSRLTRAGLTVAHAAGASLIAQEGAFGTLLLTRDVCDPPLMVGAGGRLAVRDHPRLLAPGLGIEP